MFAHASVLLCLAGCSSGPPQDLLGPGPQVGQVDRTEFKMTMRNGSITLTDGGASQKGQFDLTVEGTDEEEVLAVADGRVTKCCTRVVSDQITYTVRADGQYDSRTEAGPLQGETIEFEQVGDGWKKTLVGKEPSARQQFEVNAFPPPQPAAEYYPAGEVKPGHRWSVDVTKLRRCLGSALEVESGTCTRIFQKTLDLDGEPCAQIAEELELRGKMRDEQGEPAQVEFKVAGSLQRSLRRGFNPASRLTGTLTVSGSIPEGGKRLPMTITGPVTMEWKTQRK
jgi:hypothetical protein